MKKQMIWMVVFMVSIISVSATTGTILNSRTVLRLDSPQLVERSITVQNNNPVETNISLRESSDNLEFDKESALVPAGDTYEFNYSLGVNEPGSEKHEINFVFDDGTSKAMLGATVYVVANWTGDLKEATCSRASDCVGDPNMTGCEYDGCNYCCMGICTNLECFTDEEKELIEAHHEWKEDNGIESNETTAQDEESGLEWWKYVLAGLAVLMFLASIVIMIIKKKRDEDTIYI